MPSPIIVTVVSTLYRAGNISGVTLIGPIPVTGNLTATGQLQGATVVSTGAMTVGNGLTVTGAISSTGAIIAGGSVDITGGLTLTDNIISSKAGAGSIGFTDILSNVGISISAGVSASSLNASGGNLTFKVNSSLKATLATTGTLTLINDLAVGTGFGCNAASPQMSLASGGALAAYSTGAFGLDSDAHMHALYTLVVNMRAALVANGIMS